MKWRYEKSTKTIRSVAENHWIASMDSWDGAEDHDKNAALIAAAPKLLEALEIIHAGLINREPFDPKKQRECLIGLAARAIAAAEGGE